MYQIALQKVIGMFLRLVLLYILSHRTYSIEMHKESIARFEWPHGTYWTNEHAVAKANRAAGH